MKIVIRNGANVNTHADGSAIHKKERRTLRGEIRGPPPPLLSGIPHPTASHKSLLVQAHRVSRTGCRKRGVGRASHSPRRVSSSFKFFTFFCVFFFFFPDFLFLFFPTTAGACDPLSRANGRCPNLVRLVISIWMFFSKVKAPPSEHTHTRTQTVSAKFRTFFIVSNFFGAFFPFDFGAFFFLPLIRFRQNSYANISAEFIRKYLENKCSHKGENPPFRKVNHEKAFREFDRAPEFGAGVSFRFAVSNRFARTGSGFGSQPHRLAEANGPKCGLS